MFGEPTLGKLKQMPKSSSETNRVSVNHSSLVTKNGEHFYGENFIYDSRKSLSTSRKLTGETNSSSTSLHMDTCSWKLTGEANSTTPHVDVLWLTVKIIKHTLLDTTPQKLIGVVMTLTLTMCMSPYVVKLSLSLSPQSASLMCFNDLGESYMKFSP